ncbi:hypothetical protein [Streptomyces sp. NBC_01483]|uniref:hypothetical protein n=1 Tax=Streptomyces sp. NBC_01483 TaxID=2903883 RepID=UPI002E34DD39|nr:hypothetical protein [Streptomyces sp. NBC_01483]
MTNSSAPRRPVRMCARCERVTENPVLVHEVHAATGPGFNVYACPECAAHYPPMTDVLELLENSPRCSRVALGVNKVDAEGAVADDCGEAEVEIVAGGQTTPVPPTSAYPPCGCRRCRARRP